MINSGGTGGAFNNTTKDDIMDIRKIRLLYKGYSIVAEYWWNDNGNLFITGIEYQNSTQALMFLHEAFNADPSLYDDLEKAIYDAVVMSEMDTAELDRVAKNLQQWEA